MFLKMQKIFFPGVNKILNEKNLFFRSQIFLQKKYSKFCYDHIFHRIVMKFELDLHLNVICQSRKAVDNRLSILADFVKKLKKNQKINFFLSRANLIFPTCSRPCGSSECVEKNHGKPPSYG